MHIETGKLTLTPVSQDNFRAYKLHVPGRGRIYSTLIIESPEGLIICGDYCPRGNGVICRGYTIEWFAGLLSPDYLAEKFLTKEWVPESAQKSLAWELKWCKEKQQRQACQKALKDSAAYGIEESVFISSERFYNFYCDTFGTSPDGQGYAYNPNDLLFLCNIQKEFSRLYYADSPSAPSAPSADKETPSPTQQRISA